MTLIYTYFDKKPDNIRFSLMQALTNQKQKQSSNIDLKSHFDNIMNMTKFVFCTHSDCNPKNLEKVGHKDTLLIPPLNTEIIEYK